MNIQRFASQVWDELNQSFREGIDEYNQRISGLETEQQQLIDDYNKQYENRLNEYQNLQDQQAQNIQTWHDMQTEQQEKQTQHELDLINQNKEEAAQQTRAEQSNAYVDYLRSMNEFSGSAEQLAARGLTGTGFAKNQDIAMNIAYQNRVSSANAALMKSNREFDNQINEALLAKDSNLAMLAYQKMQQEYDLALQGFTYRDNLAQQKLAYETQTRDSYFNKINTYRDMIETYKNYITQNEQNKIKEQQWEREFAEQKRQNELENQRWWANYNEGKRQFNESMAQKKAENAMYTDTSKNAENRVLKTNTTLVNRGFSSNDAFKEYQKLEYQAKNGITAGTLNKYLNEAKSQGIYNDSDIAKIKDHFGY
jgi:hypothetical protein